MKKITFFLCCMAAIMGLGAQNTPTDADIANADIKYWVGHGEHSARFIVNWPSKALAWGYHFSEDTIYMIDVMNAIKEADPRFSFEGDSWISDLTFIEDGDTLRITNGQSWMSNVNGAMSNTAVTQTIVDNDMIKWGDPSVANVLDSMEWDGIWYPMELVWEMPVVAVESPWKDTDIDVADIHYWVGNGPYRATFIVNWADTALAWGYRFGSELHVDQMMEALAEADPRLSVNAAGGFVNDILFAENADTLRITPGQYWSYNVNGATAAGVNAQAVTDGDMVKFGDPTASIVTDSAEFDGTWWPTAQVWMMEVNPVSVPEGQVVDANIAERDLLYWVGEGDKNFTLIVNWADTALAWGMHTWYDSITVETMLNQIMATDPRFSVEMANGFVNDILFVENTDTLRITPGQYWLYNVNGSMANMVGAQYIHHHDVVKFGDPSMAVVLDSAESYGYWSPTVIAWTMAVDPVSIAEPLHGPFCGAVGSEGCNAVAANDASIRAWATSCTIVRGPQDIAVDGSPAVTYGSESDATGACSLSNNLGVVSLGDGGSATLTFASSIVNGEGPDFAVFENSFNDFFLELAFVEVSSDGEHFVRFPSTSLTQTAVQIDGIGSVDPTFINNLAGKYRSGYGTPFDLEELRDSANLDINNITHVRIIDVVGSIDPAHGSYDAFGHLINDPYPTNSYSGGFDLDGVAVMHTSALSINETEAQLVTLYPNPASSRIYVATADNSTFLCNIYDMTGREVFRANGNGNLCINLEGFANGVYMVRVNGETHRIVVRH